MELSENLQKLRRENGISQKKLAKEIGVSQASIGYWEKGQRIPSVVAVQKLADYFGVAPSYLMHENSNQQKDIIKREVSPETLKLNPGDIVVEITKDNYEKYSEYFNVLFSEVKKILLLEHDTDSKIIHIDTGKEIEKKDFEKIIDSLSEDKKILLIQSIVETLVINPIFHTLKIYFAYYPNTKTTERQEEEPLFQK